MPFLKIIEWVITCIDLFVALIIFLSALASRALTLSIVYKVGFIMTAFGLSAQAGLNIQYLTFGLVLHEHAIPLWVRLMKDMGISIVVIFFYFTKVFLQPKRTG